MSDEPCPACGDDGTLVDVGTGIPPRRACTNNDCRVIDYHIGEDYVRWRLGR